MFLIPSTKQLSMSIACCFANIHRIFVKMKQSFPISRCHSECIQFPTASCEGGLFETCGRQGAGLEKGWLPCLHEGADLFNPVRRSRNRKEASPCRSKNTCSPSEGRVGRNCMETNGIVCYMKNLLSPLQIPVSTPASTRTRRKYSPSHTPIPGSGTRKRRDGRRPG